MNYVHVIVCSNMDQFEEQSQTGNEKKKNTMWTQEMDKCLIEALVYQCNEGNKIDKGFKEVAYTAAANALNAAFNLMLNKDNVINRMKTIKRGYRDIERMLAQSGFAFNYMTKKVECSNEVWETYVKKNLRNKKLEMLEELAIICGKDAATGEWCRGGPDINSRRAADSTQFDSSIADIENEDLGNGSGINFTQINETGSQLPGSSRGKPSSHPTPRQHGKRARIGAMQIETMSAVASSIQQMAEAMERKTEIEAKKVKLDERVDASLLLKTLEEIQGLNQDSIADAFENLLRDEVKRKAFMTYSNEMLIRFLERHFQIYATNSYDYYGTL